MRSPVRSFLACTLLVCTMAGCGKEFDYGDTGTISGKLTLDGHPLEAGARVCFMEPAAGYLAYGVTDEEGNYQVSSWNEGNLPVGTYQVMVQVGQNNELMEAGDTIDDVPESKKTPVLYPKRYLSFTTSGLTEEVKKGENIVNIDLPKE